ncbi:hypothetical protein P3T35_003922 [Kitasatospora sp. GP30]|nr:hypothetical protein [Kitasatospora sp. GP30]
MAPGHTGAVPIADDPQPHSSDDPGQAAPDPFDGLELDESFLRSATANEPTARTRMLSARWRLKPPVDPGGRRWSPEPAPTISRGPRSKVRSIVPVVLAVGITLVAITIGPGSKSHSAARPAVPPSRVAGSSGPTTDVALPGGGVTDGSKCGAKGFHHFASPTPPTHPEARPGGPGPGPQLVLGSYGFERRSAHDPGRFTLDLLLAPGADQPLDLSAPLGPQGVAVEIEGPNGLVGGAYNVPITLDDGTSRTTDGRIRIRSENGGSAEVVLPAQILCPGIDALAVNLSAPLDSRNTIIGQPPYTLTVSISDPAIGALRRAVGSTAAGDVLSTDNRVPR